MADLAVLLNQLNQDAHIMENIVKAIHIPENINQAGLAHCKEYLGKALDYMTPMTSATREPSKTTVPHSSESRAEQRMLASAPTTEAKELKEAVTQTNIKYDQLRLDLGQLATNITTNEWTCSRNHTFTWGVEARSTWWDRHATISKNLIEIDGIAKRHNLTDLRARIADIRSETVALSSRMELIKLKIEATPTNSYSGDASEDKSQTAAKPPLHSMMDPEEARPRPREAIGNSYTDHYRLFRIGQTPDLADGPVKTDPAHATTWPHNYGNTVNKALGVREPEPKPTASNAHEPGNNLAIIHTPRVPLNTGTPTPLEAPGTFAEGNPAYGQLEKDFAKQHSQHVTSTDYLEAKLTPTPLADVSTAENDDLDYGTPSNTRQEISRRPEGPARHDPRDIHIDGWPQHLQERHRESLWPPVHQAHRQHSGARSCICCDLVP
jgi:hypothetical protein